MPSEDTKTIGDYIGEYLALRTLEAWAYAFGNNRMINENVSKLYYRLFSTIEHVVGYGNAFAKSFFPEMRNPGIEDVITLDVAARDLRRIMENVVYEREGRKPGLIGTVRDLANVVRRIDDNSTQHVYK